METEKKKLSFLENISAKFTKTFAEKFPEEVQENIKEKVNESAPYIVAGVVGGLVVAVAMRHVVPFKRCVTSLTIVNNYYK